MKFIPVIVRPNNPPLYDIRYDSIDTWGNSKYGYEKNYADKLAMYPTLTFGPVNNPLGVDPKLFD